MNVSKELSAWLEEEDSSNEPRPTITQAEAFSHMNQMEKLKYLLQTSPDGVCHNVFMQNYIPRFGALIWTLRHEEGWIIEKERCNDEEHNHKNSLYKYIFQGRDYEIYRTDNQDNSQQISLYEGT